MKFADFLISNFLRGGIAVIAAAGILFLCQSADTKKPAADSGTKSQKAVASEAPVVPPSGDAPVAVAPKKQQRKLIVYYFHTTMRCPTCHMLETLAKSEIETSFPDAIKSGKLEWKMINVEEKGNEHFNGDYKLYTKSIIVSTTTDGRELSWKNLDKIWQLVHDESTYRQYIRDEVKACLAGKCL